MSSCVTAIDRARQVQNHIRGPNYRGHWRLQRLSSALHNDSESESDWQLEFTLTFPGLSFGGGGESKARAVKVQFSS